jgi:hypothetical protein
MVGKSKNGTGQNRPKGNHSNKKNAFQENPEKRFFQLGNAGLKSSYCIRQSPWETRLTQSLLQ